MDVIDLKQTEIFSVELTELHQLVLNAAQRGVAIQNNPKESDTFSLHEDENYASALRRVIVFIRSKSTNMLGEVVKISSSNQEELTYETIVANIFISDVMISFYLYCGWMDQLTEKLADKMVGRLKIIGDNIKAIKNETVFDVAYKTMINQWSSLVKLLSLEKQFRTIWSYFFGYWKDPNTENFATRVRLLRFIQFSKNETSDVKIVEGVLKTIALSVKSAKKVELKAEIMEVLENLMFSLPEGSFGKELNTVHSIVSPFFNKSFEMECHGSKIEAIIHMKTNLSEIQSVTKYISGLNEINAKTEPILNYIETLCKGVHENTELYIPDSYYNLPDEAKKRISPFRVLPLRKEAEKYIQAIMGVVVNCPAKVEKEEIERRARKVVFCAAHSLPITYRILDSFFEDKEDYLSLSVMYNALHLIVNDRFLWINVEEEKEIHAKKKVLALGKRKFIELYQNVYDKVKENDSYTSITRPLSIPHHIKEFMASNCANDTYIKATMFEAVKRWREIQKGKMAALDVKKIRDTELEVVKILETWGNEIKIEGITTGISTVKKEFLSEIPEDLKNPKEIITKEKQVEKRKKVVKEEKIKEKISDEMILFVQLIRYISNLPKMYIIYTQKQGALTFFSFLTSKSDYLAEAVMEAIFIMVFQDPTYRTLIVWDLMKVIVDIMETDIPYQNMMEFVDAVMCLWTVKRINEATKRFDEKENQRKKKKGKKEKGEAIVVFTEHLSEYIEAIITVLQQRFDQSIRIETPQLLTYLYFTSLKDFDNTVWNVTHENKEYIGQYSRYLFILMSSKIPDSLLNINKMLPNIEQEQLQVTNQHLLSMDYIQTSIILKLLEENEGTHSIVQRIAKIVKKQLSGKELKNEIRYSMSNEILSETYSLKNPEFTKLGEEATPILKSIIKELMEKTEYQDPNESNLIYLLSCMHPDIFYFFVEQVKSYALPLVISEKVSIERRRQLMLTTMIILSNCLMKDCKAIFSSELGYGLMLGILSIINEVFLQLKLLWPSFNIINTTSDLFNCASNFPAYFAQNFATLLYYFCKNIKKNPTLHLEEPTNSVLPISLQLHFLVWPLEQRTDICQYLINTFINPQMKMNPITDVLCCSTLEAVCGIFSLAPLSLGEKFFIKPKRIVELEKMHSGILKWIIRFHPDLVFSRKNPDIENMTESKVIIKAIANVYSKICQPEFYESGVKAIDNKHIEFLKKVNAHIDIEPDPLFIDNLKRFGASLLHHSLITLMADDEDIRVHAFNVICWLLPIKFGLSDVFDQNLYENVIKYRVDISTTVEQNRLKAATAICEMCVKYCKEHAKIVFYKGTLAGGGNKLSDLQKKWLVTYSIYWLPYVNLAQDYTPKECNKILDILVYDVTSAMTHNSDQAIIFWSRVCEKRNDKDDILGDENSNYNIIFNFLKSELPKAKNRDSFLIVFQALMKIDLKTTFLRTAQALSYEFSRTMMISRGTYSEKYKGQYIVMNVLNDFIGDGIFVEDSGVHYMIVFSVLICYAVQDKKEVEVFYNFIKKLCYNFFDSYSSDKNPEVAKCGTKFFTLVSALEIDNILNRETLLEIMDNFCQLSLHLNKLKLLQLIKKELVEWSCSGDPTSMNVQASVNACKFFNKVFKIGDNDMPVDQFVFTLLKLKNALVNTDETQLTVEYKNVIFQYIIEIMNISDMFLHNVPDAQLMSKIMWVVSCFLVSYEVPITIYRQAIRMLRYALSPEIYEEIKPETMLNSLKEVTSNNPSMFKGILIMALRGLTDNDSKDISAEIFARVLSRPELFFFAFPKKPELVVPICIIAFTCWYCDRTTNLVLRVGDDWEILAEKRNILVENAEKLKEVKLKDYLNYCKELAEKDVKHISISVLMRNVLNCITPLVSANFVTIVELFFNECIIPETSSVFRDILMRFVVYFSTRAETKSEFVRIISNKRDIIKESPYVFDLLDVMVKSAVEQEPITEYKFIETPEMLDSVAMKIFGISKESVSDGSLSVKESVTSEIFNSSIDKSVSSKSSGGQGSKRRVNKILSRRFDD
ncbi:Hypothetical protein EHI5A_007990 [Entamoeba histolytica KU27]|uniref:Uncharacterized protein n=1 Tax=Entamoeba histolytica KU27 TaxID=885311 RepID=M2RRF6_ENTHI|nr:Hypothetical protein EHI5A_007990 [Entamoeba histolytica KU27]